MEATLEASLRETVERSSLHPLAIAACLNETNLAHILDSLVPPLVRTLARTSRELTHVLSVADFEFRDSLLSAAAAPGWKGRGRDHKGQLFKMRCEDGILVGWSAQTHAWVPVVPVSLQTMLSAWLDYFYVQCCDKDTQDAYARHKDALALRDYAETQGQRAAERGLHLIRHRRGVQGRRNKFVLAPKVH